MIGRPPIPANRRKSVTVKVRMTEAEAHALDLIRGGATRSEWIRRGVGVGGRRLIWTRRDPDDSPPDNPDEPIMDDDDGTEPPDVPLTYLASDWAEKAWDVRRCTFAQGNRTVWVMHEPNPNREDYAPIQVFARVDGRWLPVGSVSLMDIHQGHQWGRPSPVPADWVAWLDTHA